MQDENGNQRTGRLGIAAAAGLLLLLFVVVFFANSDNWQTEAGRNDTPVFPESDPERGKRLLVDYGCTGCHMVPDMRGADGLVGPTFHYWADRQYIAGRIHNTPDNLVSWIMSPQSIVPGTAMPDMGVTWGDARDMAAFLYTLRYNR